MSDERLTEQAALIALLRSRPGGMSWPEVTAEALEAGSAAEVWARLTPTPLLEYAAEEDPLVQARSDLVTWMAEGLTVLDPGYPSRLREVHQAPPILFARGSRGSFVTDDRAVSVVGSWRASEAASRSQSSYVVVALTFLAGIVATVLQLRYADNTQ